MEVCQEYYGLPPPPVGFGQPLQLTKGDIIELTRADVDLPWWEVKLNMHCVFRKLSGGVVGGGGGHTFLRGVFKTRFLWLMCGCEMLKSFSVAFVISVLCIAASPPSTSSPTPDLHSCLPVCLSAGYI